MAIGAVSGALLALALTACGVSGGSAVSSSAKLVPYTIGYDAVESGPLAPYAVGIVGYFSSWLDYVDAHGGIDGHHLKLITLDDHGDAAQALLNTETLWSQDHVLALAQDLGTGVPSPYSYIRSNNIPTYGFASNPEDFATANSSIFSIGGVGPAWSSAYAYFLVKVQHKHPTTVAVDYSPAYSTWIPFIKNYWQQVGVKNVFFWADGGGAADCTAEVLAMKSEGVQYLDMQGTEGPGPCILAEQRLGWRPVDGQGGPIASQIGQALLIGRPMVGVTAGSPQTLYTGSPIYSHPSSEDKTLVGNIRKYAPALATYALLNGTAELDQYGTAQLITYDIQHTLEKYGKVTPTLLVKFSQSVRNWSNGLQAPIASFSPTCKTGSNENIIGHWAWNAHPTAFKPEIYLLPTSGKNWIGTTWMKGVSKCVLTQVANQYFPNG